MGLLHLKYGHEESLLPFLPEKAALDMLCVCGPAAVPGPPAQMGTNKAGGALCHRDGDQHRCVCQQGWRESRSNLCLSEG